MYNINDSFNPKYKYSMTELSMEIVTEYHGANKNDYRMVYRRLTNDSNGLVQRLNKNLSYDINLNAGDNKKYKFEKFQLLNMLYRLEAKSNLPDEKRKLSDKRVNVIGILSKPRMQNVISGFSNSCVHGSVFADLIEDLMKIADPESKQIKLMNDINNKWQRMLRSITFNFSASDKVLKEPELYLSHLRKANCFLNSVLDLLQKYNKNKELNEDKFKCNILNYQTGVLETFLNILYVHHFLCYDIEVKRLCEPINIWIDENYGKAFESLENQMFQTELIPDLIYYLKHPKTHTNNRLYNLIISLIVHGLNNCEPKDIVLALERVAPVLKLIEVEKQVDLSQEIDITLFISVIQEIIYIHKNSVQIKIDTLGFTTGEKALSKLLTSGYEEEPAIMRIAWELRLANRVLINFNLSEHITEARKIEKTIYKIKKEVYSYINLDDIKSMTNLITSAFKIYAKTDFHNEAYKFLINDISKRLSELQKTNGQNAIKKN